jgi:hypothetical protein
MKKIKIILIVLVGLTVLIAPLLIIETIYNKNISHSQEGRNNKKISAYNETAKTPYMPLKSKMQNVEDQNKILDILYEYVFAVNDGEYEKAYNMLLPAYRESRYTTLDDFIWYCKARGDVDMGITIDKLERSISGSFFADVTIFSDNMDEPIEESQKYRYRDHLAVTKGNNQYYLAFDGFLEVIPMDEKWQNDKLSIHFIKEERYVNKNEYVVEVENLTDDMYNLWDVVKNVQISNKNGEIFWISNRDNTAEYDLYPKEPIQVKWSFKHKIKDAKILLLQFSTDFHKENVKIHIN